MADEGLQRADDCCSPIDIKCQNQACVVCSTLVNRGYLSRGLPVHFHTPALCLPLYLPHLEGLPHRLTVLYTSCDAFPHQRTLLGQQHRNSNSKHIERGARTVHSQLPSITLAISKASGVELHKGVPSPEQTCRPRHSPLRAALRYVRGRSIWPAFVQLRKKGAAMP